MKTFVLAVIVMVLSACASMSSSSPDQRLALYQAHAGAPVSSIRYLGRFSNWTSLDDSTIAVWTNPNEAWLLDLAGPCNGIEYAQAIGLTQQTGRVYARFDKVLVDNRGGGGDMPCRIETIRPLDVKAIKQAEHDARAQAAAGYRSSGT